MLRRRRRTQPPTRPRRRRREDQIAPASDAARSVLLRFAPRERYPVAPNSSRCRNPVPLGWAPGVGSDASAGAAPGSAGMHLRVGPGDRSTARPPRPAKGVASIDADALRDRRAAVVRPLWPVCHGRADRLGGRLGPAPGPSLSSAVPSHAVLESRPAQPSSGSASIPEPRPDA